MFPTTTTFDSMVLFIGNQILLESEKVDASSIGVVEN